MFFILSIKNIHHRGTENTESMIQTTNKKIYSPQRARRAQRKFLQKTNTKTRTNIHRRGTGNTERMIQTTNKKKKITAENAERAEINDSRDKYKTQEQISPQRAQRTQRLK
jgi:hypothetical protein